MSTVLLTEKKEDIFYSATRKARRITFTVMIISDLLAAAWMSAPFIKHLMEDSNNATNNEIGTERKWLNFCYIIWFPIDITVSPYYEIMYFMQCIVFIIATTYLKATDTCIASMMVHISAQFEILYTALKDIDIIILEKKKKNAVDLRFFNPRKPFGRETNISLDEFDDPQVKDVGTQKSKAVQTRRAIGCNSADMDFKDRQTENESFPELTSYLANFVQYHQDVIK
jgi:hypothetical protein